MENAEINLRRGAKRYVAGRAWNLRYVVIWYNVCERFFVLTARHFPPSQCLPFTITSLAALSDISISITSGPSECAVPSMRASPPGSLPLKGWVPS